MFKRKSGLMLAAVSVFLLVSCGIRDGYKLLKSDSDAEEATVSTMDLDGHTLTIKHSNSILSDVKNGNVIIGEGVERVTFKGGCDLDTVTVNSEGVVILENGVKVGKINIKKTTTIQSSKSIAARYAREAGEDVAPGDGTGEPVIGTIEVEPKADVVLEGGKIDTAVSKEDSGEKADVIIPKDSTAVIKTLSHADKDGKVDTSRNLTFKVDDAYEGNGIKVDITGKPVDALVRQVIKIKDGIWMGIEWIEDTPWTENREKVHEKSFIYEYLDADKTYELVFKYYKPIYVDANGSFSEEKILLSSDVVEVTPKKGHEVKIKMEEGSSLAVDEDTGTLKWKGDLPSVSISTSGKRPYISYTVWSLAGEDWKWIGGYDVPLTEEEIFKDVNIYSDFSINKIDNINSDNKVFVTSNYNYDGFSWDITRTEEFKFNKSYYPEVAVSEDNMITFTRGADEKIVPSYKGEKADGYYIWLYNGNVGAYIAYKGKPSANDKIDINVIVESKPELKKKLEENGNLYSFDLSWYKTVVDENGKPDNVYLCTMAHKDNLKYFPQSGYTPIELSLAEDKVTVTPPSAPLLESYKTLGDRIALDIYVDDEYLWVPFEQDADIIKLDGFSEKKVLDLTNKLVYHAVKIKGNSGKYKVVARLRNGDDWKSEIASIEGTFDSTGCELPTVSVVGNKMQFKAPGSKLVQMLKATGANEYWLHIRNEYGYKEDNSDMLYFVHGISLDTLKCGDVSLTDEVDLKQLLMINTDSIVDGKIWIDLSAHPEDGVDGWWDTENTGVKYAEYKVNFNDCTGSKLTYDKETKTIKIEKPSKAYWDSIKAGIVGTESLKKYVPDSYCIGIYKGTKRSHENPDTHIDYHGFDIKDENSFEDYNITEILTDNADGIKEQGNKILVCAWYQFSDEDDLDEGGNPKPKFIRDFCTDFIVDLN